MFNICQIWQLEQESTLGHRKDKSGQSKPRTQKSWRMRIAAKKSICLRTLIVNIESTSIWRGTLAILVSCQFHSNAFKHCLKVSFVSPDKIIHKDYCKRNKIPREFSKKKEQIVKGWSFDHMCMCNIQEKSIREGFISNHPTF